MTGTRGAAVAAALATAVGPLPARGAAATASVTPGPAGVAWEDGEITLRTVAYPVERTIEKLKQLSLPADIVDALAQLLRTGVPMKVRDADAGSV